SERPYFRLVLALRWFPLLYRMMAVAPTANFINVAQLRLAFVLPHQQFGSPPPAPWWGSPLSTHGLFIEHYRNHPLRWKYWAVWPQGDKNTLYNLAGTNINTSLAAYPLQHCHEGTPGRH
ncbi:hypothetical protein EV363DRAFT_1184220, partial [Boletus edulis]